MSRRLFPRCHRLGRPSLPPLHQIVDLEASTRRDGDRQPLAQLGDSVHVALGEVHGGSESSVSLANEGREDGEQRRVARLLPGGDPCDGLVLLVVEVRAEVVEVGEVALGHFLGRAEDSNVLADSSREELDEGGAVDVFDVLARVGVGRPMVHVDGGAGELVLDGEGHRRRGSLLPSLCGFGKGVVGSVEYGWSALPDKILAQNGAVDDGVGIEVEDVVAAAVLVGHELGVLLLNVAVGEEVGFALENGVGGPRLGLEESEILLGDDDDELESIGDVDRSREGGQNSVLDISSPTTDEHLRRME